MPRQCPVGRRRPESPSVGDSFIVPPGDGSGLRSGVAAFGHRKMRFATRCVLGTLLGAGLGFGEGGEVSPSGVLAQLAAAVAEAGRCAVAYGATGGSYACCPNVVKGCTLPASWSGGSHSSWRSGCAVGNAHRGVWPHLQRADSAKGQRCSMSGSRRSGRRCLVRAPTLNRFVSTLICALRCVPPCPCSPGYKGALFACDIIWKRGLRNLGGGQNRAVRQYRWR